MKEKPLLIHFHNHHRRTGVTSSIENVLPELQKYFETYLHGNQVHWSYYLTIKELKKKIKQHPVVIVHAHRNNEILKALWLRFLGFRFKLVVTRHAATIPSALTLGLMRKADERIGLIDEMKSLPFKIDIIGHGVNVNRFIADPTVTLEQVHQKNFMVVAGRVRPKKGHKTVVKAIAPILKEHNNWALIIVGKVDDLSFVKELKADIKENQIEQQVYFIEETSSIEKFYQASKATIIPSHSEGFSLVCLEAMACESITIATQDVGVHSKVIKDQQTGYLFEAGNHQQLHQILNAVVHNNHKISTVEARNDIQKYWSAKVEARQLKELYLRPCAYFE